MSHPGGGSGTGPGGGGGTGPGRDFALPAGELLAEADTVAPPQPLTYLTGLAQTLLADALNLVDGGLAVALTPEVETRLLTAAFHLQRALAEIGPLTPARTPHWHDLVRPADRSGS